MRGMHLTEVADLQEQAVIATPVRDIAFYWELANCATPQQMAKRVRGLLRTRGITDFNFGLAGAAAGLRARVMTTRPGMLRHYREQGFFARDLAVQHALDSTQPLFQSSIAAFVNQAPCCNTEWALNLRLTEFYRRQGFADIYYIPLRAEGYQGNALLSVACRHLKAERFALRIQRYHSDLLLLARTIDYVSARSFPHYFAPFQPTRRSLNPRPLALLKTLARDNLSLREAAEKLCISLDTANKHMASAKRGLGAKTQASAVYRALETGMWEQSELNPGRASSR